MVICKFFLQGNCKFGNSCKFEHDQGGGGGGGQCFGGQSFSSPLNSRGHVQTLQRPTQHGGGLDTPAMGNIVISDMKATEKGGQWLLSSYAPFQEKPEFPGFENYSFEEIRQMYYEAAKTGASAIEQFKHQWQTLQQNAMIKVKALQNLTPDLINLLMTIYNSKPSNVWTSQQSSTPFGVTAANTNSGSSNSVFSIFSQSTPSPFPTTGAGIFGPPQQGQKHALGGSIFEGGQQHQQGVFSSVGGQQSSVFAQAGAPSQSQSQSGSIFAPSQNQTQSTGMFAQVIGNAGQQGSIFSKPAAQSAATTGNLFAPQGGNLFSNRQAEAIMSTDTTSAGVFSQPAAGIFSSQSPGNIFQTSSSGSANPTSSGSIFSMQMQNAGQNAGIPGADSQNTSQRGAGNIFQTNFNSGTGSSIFSAQSQGTTQSGAIFSVGDQNSSTGGGSIFASGQTVISRTGASSIFGNRQNAQQADADLIQTAYSKLEDLTEAEIKWFQSDDIDIENIPIKPPTYEMCA